MQFGAQAKSNLSFQHALNVKSGRFLPGNSGYEVGFSYLVRNVALNLRLMN
jgi:hypothetical protein